MSQHPFCDQMIEILNSFGVVLDDAMSPNQTDRSDQVFEQLTTLLEGQERIVVAAVLTDMLRGEIEQAMGIQEPQSAVS